MARSRNKGTLEELACALAAGYAGHWLITPDSHPAATSLAYTWAWLQLLGGIGLWVFLSRRHNAEKAGSG